MKTSFSKYQYIQRWRKEHPEKLKEYKKRWAEKHPEKQKEYSKKWRKKHPDYYRNWREKHLDKYPYKQPVDLRYERNKLIYQARTIQKLNYEDIGKIIKNKEGKPLSRQRIHQIVKEYEKSLGDLTK